MGHLVLQSPFIRRQHRTPSRRGATLQAPPDLRASLRRPPNFSAAPVRANSGIPHGSATAGGIEPGHRQAFLIETDERRDQLTLEVERTTPR